MSFRKLPGVMILLASAAVLDGVQGVDSRYVGSFVLKGKTVGLPLFELGAQHVADRLDVDVRLSAAQRVQRLGGGRTHIEDLAGHRVTCNIDRVGEILPCPQSTPVPGAKSWIIGLANVRGELLTVVDLAWYVSGVRSPITNNSRLLATSLNKAPIGLLIDEVYGQRHFLDSDAKPAELEEDSAMHGLVSKRHDMGSERWHELDLDRLFTTPEFLNGAAEP